MLGYKSVPTKISVADYTKFTVCLPFSLCKHDTERLSDLYKVPQHLNLFPIPPQVRLLMKSYSTERVSTWDTWGQRR